MTTNGLARHVIIGTAGHVDHGKTTLIRALTGIDTDRLAEEKARGMTIDLGFAFMDLPGEPPILAGVVDVPGHERFLKNMLAGVGGIDIALVVVAADEGPMPQTKEHLDILTVLGVTVGVVALTKADLVDPELRELTTEMTHEALASTSLADAPIIPVSAETGEGLDALRLALAQASLTAPLRSPNIPFRLPVDRVFSVPGVGTVATGTLVAGTLTVGDPIAVEPQGLTTRARTLQTHHRKVERATPRMRVAVNLPGIDVGQIERGAVLSPPGTIKATTLFDAHVMLLPDVPRLLKHRSRVRLHLGTGEVLARVQLLDRDTIEPGATEVPVQLLCESAAAPIRGERFVLRTYSPAHVIGGGTVLDPFPVHRYRKSDAAALRLFTARKAFASMNESVYAVVAARPQSFSVAEIATTAGIPESEATTALESLVEERRVEVLSDGHYLADVTATRVRDTARRTLGTFHRQNPLKRAMPRDGLRVPLSKAAAADFNSLLLWLTQKGEIVAEGTMGFRLPEHEIVLSPASQKAKEDMLAVYKSAGLLPPSPLNFQAHLPRDVNVKVILGILVDAGELVSIGDDLYLTIDALNQAKEAVQRLAKTPEGISVATVRDATGSSRKVILPLLEYLDAVKFTKRQGDARVLAE